MLVCVIVTYWHGGSDDPCDLLFCLFMADVTSKSQPDGAHYNVDNMELKTSFPLHIDHTHNIYVAIAVLVSSAIIFFVMVSLFLLFR